MLLYTKLNLIKTIGIQDIGIHVASNIGGTMLGPIVFTLLVG